MALSIRQAYLKSNGANVNNGVGVVQALDFGIGGDTGFAIASTKSTEQSGKLVMQTGAVATPSFTNSSSETTGISFPSSGVTIAHSIAGVEKSRLTATEEKKMVPVELREQNALRLYDAESGTAYYAAIRAASALTQNFTFTWPSNYGTLNQPLISNGAGGLSFGTAASIAADTYSITFGETIAQYKVVGVDPSTQKALNAVDEYTWSIAPTNTNQSRCTTLILDGSGNIIVCGVYRGTLTFAGASAITSGQSGTNWGFFLARINASTRNADWAITINDVLSAQNSGHVLATDDTSIWVAGTFSSAYALSVPNVADPTTTGGASLWVAKVVSATGVVSATLTADSTSASALNSVTGIVVSGAAGYICGHMETQITFNSAASVAGTRQLFLAKFNATTLGSWTWNVYPSAGYGYSGATGVVLDGSSQPIICGYYEGTMTLSGLSQVTSGGGYDAFVALANTSGVWQWVAVGGGVGKCVPTSITLNSTSVYICGSFKTSLTMAGVSGVVAAYGVEDGFVACVNTSGVWQWTTSAKGLDAVVSITDISYSSSGLFVCGVYDKELICGSVPTLRGGRGVGKNAFTAKLNISGVWQWSSRSNTPVKNIVALDADSTGAVVAGDFTRTVSFGTLSTLSSVSGYKNLVIYRVNNKIYELGISLESGTADQSKTIHVRGVGTFSGQSYTPSLTYYNNNGVLSTSGTTRIGRAIASDKILMDIDFNNY